MTAVIPVREVALFGNRYRVPDGVKRQARNQIVPVITIGDNEGAPREEGASSWYWTTVKGGFGRYRLVQGQGQTPSQYFDSSLRTDTGLITLLPLATDLFDLGVAPVDMLQWGTSTYVVGGTTLRRITSGRVVQFYCTLHSAWETDPPTGLHTAKALPGTAVSLSIYSGKLVVWCGAAGFMTYDGSTTFANVGTDGMYGLTFDGKHVSVTTTGQIKTTTDLATLTDIASARAYDCTPTSLAVGLDGARNPTIYLGTTRGLFALDWVAQKLYPVQVVFNDAHADNCRGTRVWNGSLMYTKGGSVRSYQPASGIAQVSDIGPNLDDGLPSTKVGRVVALEATLEHMLLAAMDAGSGTSGVYLYRGSGWHPLVVASAANLAIRTLSFTTSTTPSCLFFSQGTHVWWIPWDDLTSNPTQQPAGSTYRASGTLTTAWFGAAAIRQLAIDLRVLARKITTTETGSFEAAFDDDDSDAAWVSVGSLSRNGMNTILFNNGAQPFRTARLRLTLVRGATTTLAPWVSTGALRWTALPKALYSYSFVIDGSRPYGGLSPTEIETALTAVTDAAVGVFSYRPADPVGDRTVRVKEMRDQSATGIDSRGKWSVQVDELVPATEAEVTMDWSGAYLWDGSATWG